MSGGTVRTRAAEYALIVASVGLAAVGQVLMKLGTARLGGGGLAQTIGSGLGEPLVVVGILSYVVSSAVWLVVLSRVPLSLAYPFGALAYVVVVTVALLTGERITWVRWLGVLLIVGGISLVGGSATDETR